jgi:hypothetical protein
MRSDRLWIPVLLWPLAAGSVFFVCLRVIAPQDSYCDSTASTFPWYAGAGLNIWGGVGLGLIVAAGMGVAAMTRGSGASSRLRGLVILIAFAFGAALVSLAYLVPYLDHSCGE